MSNKTGVLPTSYMRVQVGERPIFFSRSWPVRCPGVAAAMWSWQSMTRACTRRGAVFKALSINTIRYPKFRYNLMFGLRFLQVSLLVPLYRHAKASPRGLPVRFEEVPAVKRPPRRAADEVWAAYRAAAKQQNLSQRAVELFRGLRQSLDQAGSACKCLLVVGDNSFCNRTLFTAALERTAV